MDTEHHKIINYCNDIHAKVASGVKQEPTLTVLKDLAAFTSQHFAAEEKLMQRHAYPDLPRQISAHTALLARVARVVDDIKSGVHINMIEVVVFLTDWLKGHILGEDLKYGQYFQDQGIDA